MRAAKGLALLGRMGVSRVPRLLGSGESLGVTWSSESFITGRIPRSMSGTLRRQLIEFCLQLTSDDAVSTLQARLHAIGQHYPAWKTTWDAVESELDLIVRNLPSVVQHGDLWMANLLVRDGALVGVVDWDTWDPHGMPAVDLLHLWATLERPHTVENPGPFLLDGSWDSDEFRSATLRYWHGMGLRPDRKLLFAVAVDWWALNVTTALRRPVRRQRVAAPAWIERNVVSVAEAMSRGAIG